MELETKYLKSDEHYADKHDRMMFNILKKKERKLEKLKKESTGISKAAYYLAEHNAFLHKKYQLWKNRDDTIIQ